MTGFSWESNAQKARYNAWFGDFKNLTEPKAVHAPKAGALPTALHPDAVLLRLQTKFKPIIPRLQRVSLYPNKKFLSTLKNLDFDYCFLSKKGI